jgi:phage tail-like protein
MGRVMAIADRSARDARDDPFVAFRFRVEIDSLQVSGFSEATGLSIETDVQKFREGGFNLHERQLAGPGRFPSNLVLKRGLADADALWSWYRDIMEGRITRKRVAIVLMNAAGEEKWRWVFRQACPVKWIGPELRAGRTEIAFEAIEMIHKGLEPGAQSGLR